MAGKYSINLLQDELFPEKPLWSLGRVVTLWCVALIAMLLWLFVNQFLLQQQQAQKNELLTVQSQQQALFSDLEAQLAKSRPDAELVSRLATLKLVMANKQTLHAQLTDSTRTSVTGFASAMTELSKLHHQDISLTRVNISNDDMTFTGLAKAADAVPAWLAGFEDSVLLSGKSFINFKLEENEQKLTTFEVSSKHDAKVQ
ncbi:PilN domain-containing protein [Colwelliaceae bacterium 6471]